jgi:DNA polymerase III delta prime subunit
MLEARVKELEKELERECEHDKRIMSRPIAFLRKAAAEKEETKKEAAEKEVASHLSN